MFNAKKKQIANQKVMLENAKERIEKHDAFLKAIEKYYQSAKISTIKEIAMVSKKGKIKWKPYKDLSDTIVSIGGQEYKQEAVQGFEVRTRQIIEYDGIKPSFHSDPCLSYLAEYYHESHLSEMLERNSPLLAKINI
jgi:hypothetical protein